MNSLAQFAGQETVALTSYRRDGTPVRTPVHIAVDGDRAYVRTWSTAAKFRRIRRNPEITLAPSTRLGQPTGPAIKAHATVLDNQHSGQARKALARKYPILHGVIIPLGHRLAGKTTVHFEVTPACGGTSASIRRD